jgi:predicted phage terminase large subunit-like protein
MADKQYFNDDSRYKDIIKKPTRNHLDLMKEFENQKELVISMANKPLEDDSRFERIERAKNDFQYFVKTYMSHHCKHEKTGDFIELADFHLEAAEALDTEDNFLGLFEWSRNHGKRQSLESKILTPTGFKMLCELKEGDLVIGGDGKPTKIVFMTPIVERDLYRLKTADGRSTLCDLEHLWEIDTTSKKRIKGTNKRVSGYVKKVVNTQWLIDKGLSYNRKDGYRDSKYFIDTCKPVEYTKKDLLIEPYTLGVLLGDGSIQDGCRVHTHRDDIEELMGYIPYKVGNIYTDKRNNNAQQFTIYGLCPSLKELDMKHNVYNKRIPEIYLQGSVEQRIDLVRGLMDTDGTLNKPGADFSTCNRVLAYQFVDLIRGLGGTTSIKFTENDTAGHYRIGIRFTDINPFRLKRKADNYVASPSTKNAIISIELEKKGLGRCIKVDNKDELYITDDYLVTHNTTVSLFIAMWMIIRGECHNLVYVSKSKDFSISQIQNIQAEFENNAALIGDFGSFKEAGAEWRADRFCIPSRDFACSALGRGQSPRGIKYKNWRPDFIIVDDIDDDENSRNQKRVRQLIEWFNSELFNTVGIYYKILMIGNKFAEDSLIGYLERKYNEEKNQGKNNIYFRRVNAITDDNKVAWPQRFTMEYLVRRKEEIGRIAFEREWMNNPIREGYLFKADNIHLKNMEIESYTTIVMYIDPSWSDTSDYKAVVVMGKDEEDFHIIDIFLRRCTMGMMVDWCFKWYITHYDKSSIYIYMETNIGQKYLMNEFEFAEKQYGITLPLVDDSRQKKEKYARIEAMTPFFERNKIFFNANLENTEELSASLNQLLSYEKDATINDDFPDALEGAITKINFLKGGSKLSVPLIQMNNEDWDW